MSTPTKIVLGTLALSALLAGGLTLNLLLA